MWMDLCVLKFCNDNSTKKKQLYHKLGKQLSYFQTTLLVPTQGYLMLIAFIYFSNVYSGDKI